MKAEDFLSMVGRQLSIKPVRLLFFPPNYFQISRFSNYEVATEWIYLPNVSLSLPCILAHHSLACASDKRSRTPTGTNVFCFRLLLGACSGVESRDVTVT
ncbi:hypothetical protein AVEN_117425-1 [Araneus ventricosus]|uniref:Uncharacterized protein n=1 Tax=Araneus ventricosus TaxID=182803 RepID=A0A4Y2QHA9_ARAVE|nr:hypothetical protein AVEN_117425-1 [Araneus ventricosus]